MRIARGVRGSGRSLRPGGLENCWQSIPLVSKIQQQYGGPEPYPKILADGGKAAGLYTKYQNPLFIQRIL